MKKINIHYGQFLEDQYNKNNKSEDISFDHFVTFFSAKELFKHIFRYREVYFFCENHNQISRIFLILLMCKLLTFRKVKIIEPEKTSIYGWSKIIVEGLKLGIEFATYKKDYRFHKKMLAVLCQKELRLIDRIPDEGTVLYVRGNVPSGLISGGSIAHALGVINNLSKFKNMRPVVISFERLKGIDENITKRYMRGEFAYKNMKDYISIAINNMLYDELSSSAKGKQIYFIYQRYSMNCYAGLRYALEQQIPFVLEYNSSEVWKLKNWGKGKSKYLDFSKNVEHIVLEKATMIVCVSQALKDQLVTMGIPERKILVNYNAVDTDKYSPRIDGSQVRKKYHIAEDKAVVAFIGTFDMWHGTEILAKAFIEAVRVNKNIHLLLIGNGKRMDEVREILKNPVCEGKYTLTGFVSQERGPEYLAAGDILVSPTIRNPDGTPFFGSPTKIFEYMAMGKAIIASDLDQLSEVITDQYSGILCEPGNVNVLSEAILNLAGDKSLRNLLGEKARDEACRNHTWLAHVEKIYMKLGELL